MQFHGNMSKYNLEIACRRKKNSTNMKRAAQTKGEAELGASLWL